MKAELAWYQLLIQKRMFVVLLLGFSSGLPLGLTMTTLQAWFTVENVDLVTIGFLGLVGQPYVYKFIWAPAVDKMTPSFLGRRRGWMLITQLGLMALLILIAGFSPATTPWVIGVIALSIAVMSATQDIVIDAYRTELLPAEERGTGAAMAVAGYRIAVLVSGGLALILADYIGFKWVYIIMAGFMGIGVFATLFGAEPVHHRAAPQTFTKACIEPFKEFLSRKNAISLLLLIVLYKMGDAFAGSLTTTFLLRGLDFSLQDVGLINKTVGLVTTLVGAFMGGLLMSKIGLYRSLLWFGFAQAVTNFLFMVLAWAGKDYGLMILTIALENLAGGMGTAAFIALLMSLCDERYTATQFALLSALSAVGRVFVGPTAGYLVSWLGWAEFFFYTVVFSIPGLILLVLLKNSISAIDFKFDDNLEAGAEPKNS
tara:strand:- start:84272 stop:85555 length:1284 start_codon:yes stop_codon:yes gene_type:complete